MSIFQRKTEVRISLLLCYFKQNVYPLSMSLALQALNIMNKSTVSFASC